MRTLNKQERRECYPSADLKEASTFGALPRAVIEWLVDQGETMELEDGEPLFQPGEPGDSFYVILEGGVSHEKFHRGAHTHTRDYEPGQEIGFVSMVALHPRVGLATAIGKTVVVRIDSKLFLRMHHEYPEAFGVLVMNLAREMARTIRTLSNSMVEIATRTGGASSGG